MPPQFGPALRWLQKLLNAANDELNQKINFALIGGLSVAAWGAVRATQDIDFLVDTEPSPIGDVQLRQKLTRYLIRRGCKLEWRVGDADDPVPLLLRIELPKAHGGLGADLLWAHKRWQRDALTRTVTVKVARFGLAVLHPEDLIVLKLTAGGPQDWLDVQRILADPPPQLDFDRLKKSAARQRLGRMLERCLRGVGQ